MKSQPLPAQTKINYQQTAKELIGNALTRAISVNGHDALQRFAAACQYIESDSNIVYKEFIKAIETVRWESLVGAMIETGNLKNRNEVIAFTKALQMQLDKQIKEWHILDQIISTTANLVATEEKHFAGIEGVVRVYNETIPATDMNSAVLSVVQLWCKDMPTDKQRSFARLLTKSFEAQQLITK
jgi:hypothetical protein